MPVYKNGERVGKQAAKSTVRFRLDELPHEPGSLARQATQDRAQSNNLRAVTPPVSGTVVGSDSTNGQQIIRMPGGQLTRSEPTGSRTGDRVNLAPLPPLDPRLSVPNPYSSLRSASAVTQNIRLTPGGPTTINPNNGRRTNSFSFSYDRNDWGVLSDPCTPPEVRGYALNQIWSALPRASSTGFGAGSFEAVAGGINQASFRAQQEALELYLQGVSAAEQLRATLPSSVTAEGTLTVNAQWANNPLLWECTDNGCIPTSNGIYATKAECEQACQSFTWSCVGGVCVQVPGQTGAFASLAECQSSGCATRYSCESGQCVPNKNGEFSSLAECQSSGCYWGYDCVNGDCVPAIGGAYRSLGCCQSLCTDVLTAWPGSIGTITFDSLTQPDEWVLLAYVQDFIELTQDGPRGDGPFTSYLPRSIQIPAQTQQVFVNFTPVTLNPGFSRYLLEVTAVGAFGPGTPFQVVDSWDIILNDLNNYYSGYQVIQLINLLDDPQPGLYAVNAPNVVDLIIEWGPLVTSHPPTPGATISLFSGDPDLPFNRLPHPNPGGGQYSLGS